MEIMEILKKFDTQEKCIGYLEELRWSGEPQCPYCGSTEFTTKRKELRYRCKSCNNSFSVLVGTIMESTKLPLPKWFAAICLILNAKKGISSLQLSRDIGVNKNTAWYVQKRIRQAMDEDDTILGGIVEADETFVGGALGNKHQKHRSKFDKTGMQHKTPVLGMMERNGKICVKVLFKAWGNEIKPVLLKKIDPESEIITDGFGGYQGIGKYFKKHIKLNHSKGIRVEGEYHTNTLEGFWSMLKRSIIGQYHKVTPIHLQGYVDEIAFKYNYRNSNDAFKILMTNALNTGMP